MSLYPKVSVIVPIYGVEKYIEKCAESLMQQTLEDIEYIFINDGTSDNSMRILNDVIVKYPNRLHQCKIIDRKTNKKIAYTRSEGLKIATGDYIIFCDPDDWIDVDLYKGMYETAIIEDAEIVVCDIVLETEDKSTNRPVPLIKDWEEFKTYPSWLFLNLWCHLVKRSILINNELNFYPDINYSEDNGLVFRYYFYSKKNAKYTGDAKYHYYIANDSSLTKKKFKLQNIDDKAKCFTNLCNFFRERGGNPLKNAFLREEMRAIKESYYLSDTPDFKKWQKLFPEITSIIVKDKKLSLPYRISWTLGQYIHPMIFKFYVNLSSRHS